MRTFTSLTFAILFAALSVPAFASAQTLPQPNGSICYAPSDCASWNCVFSDLEGVAKCQPMPPQPNGKPCDVHPQCISGYCSDGGICAENPNGGGTGIGGTNPGGNQGPAGTNPSVTLINPLNSGTSLTSFLNNILDFVINIGSVVVILMLVFVGYKFVVAQGKDAALVEARKMLLWTIIGALVLLGAKAISASILLTVQSLGG